MYTLEHCNSFYEYVKSKILHSHQYLRSTDWVYWVSYSYHLFFHSVRMIATRKRTALTERQLFYVGKQGETFMYDEDMPSLPVASLDDAMSMYLDSVKPLVTEEEYLKTEEIVNNFKEGVGKELYEKVWEKAQTEKNWMEKWWLEQAYLNIRFPMIPYLNMSGCTPIEGYNVPKPDHWLDHAALHLYFQMQFWKLIRREKLRPFINRGQPWSMNQLKTLFNTTRIPRENKDDLHTYFKTESDGPCGPKHIAVACRGHIFTFKILDENEEPLTAPEIAWNLEQIYNWCENHDEGPYVGALTTADRDVWAKNRQALMEIDENNKTCLEDIDTAIQMFVLDNQEPQNDDEMQRFTLCADKLDRWADKSLTTFLFRNGCMSGSSDHAPYDGMVSMTISHYIQISLKAYGGEWQGSKKIRELPKPSRLPFNLDEHLSTEIEKAKQHYKTLCLNLQTKYCQFTTYGKAFIKPYNIRPEAYVQLSLQLAYNRIHGKPAPTYMTASTRQFYHGRTETCRTCTSECLEWVKAMDDPDSSVAEKVRLMYKAVDKMNTLLTKCMKGFGCDRLLLGLSCLADELNMEKPELFTDPSYTKSGGGGNFILSTSCTGYTPMSGSVAPMCVEGYGAFYSIENNRIGFQITAYNMFPETDVHKYYNSIETALKDMQNVLVASKL